MDETNAAPGWGEQLSTMLTGYVSKRIDVDLNNRLAVLGTVTRGGTQTAIVNSPATGMTAGATSNNTLVYAALAAGALALFFVLRKG